MSRATDYWMQFDRQKDVWIRLPYLVFVCIWSTSTWCMANPQHQQPNWAGLTKKTNNTTYTHTTILTSLTIPISSLSMLPWEFFWRGKNVKSDRIFCGKCLDLYLTLLSMLTLAEDEIDDQSSRFHKTDTITMDAASLSKDGALQSWAFKW